MKKIMILGAGIYQVPLIKKAKEMILNTNMKINDIAKEVGYLDTSYFYRKFKQCYGVSPASLRGMKKY